MKYKGVEYIGFWYSKLELKYIELKILFDLLDFSFNVLLWTNYFDNALLFINTESKGIKYFGVW